MKVMKNASVLHRDSFVYPNAFGGNRKDHTGSLFRAEKKEVSRLLKCIRIISHWLFGIS